MKILFYLIIFLSLFSCQKNPAEKPKDTIANKTYKYLNLSKDFKAYWFDGNAEISTYQLSQMRYGEPREGDAVLIFVKEPFLSDAQVKANQSSKASVDVLKLNFTKNFNTGIYPYSVMQSVFTPLSEQPNAIKVSASIQEWCGQTYMQLNNRENFNITSHSYFEGEEDQNLKLKQTFLENELWTKLRINPQDIPKGTQDVIPDFSYLRLFHQPTQHYRVTIDQSVISDTLITELKYESIDRSLKIYQSPVFPFQILKWQEKGRSGITQAVLKQTLKIDYWNKNSNKFEYLRDSLKLK